MISGLLLQCLHFKDFSQIISDISKEQEHTGFSRQQEVSTVMKSDVTQHVKKYKGT